MDKLKLLARIRELYSRGENILDHLKSLSGSVANCTEDIAISYDFQAGSYAEAYRKDTEYFLQWGRSIAEIIERRCVCNSIVEVGVGDGTSLGPVLMAMRHSPRHVFGFDLSWSRVKVARAFLRSHGDLAAELFVGDMFCTPFADNSVDVVFTSHAIEPNGGRETEILRELYRVARSHLVLVEPAYELADEDARQRMRRLGYVTRLRETAQELGYTVVEHRLMETCRNPLNPSGVLVIRKEDGPASPEALCCPITKTPLQRGDDSWYSPQSLLAYPMVQGIACLLPQMAVIATKYEQDIAWATTLRP